jgi:hypothetical protein
MVQINFSALWKNCLETQDWAPLVHKWFKH